MKGTRTSRRSPPFHYHPHLSHHSDGAFSWGTAVCVCVCGVCVCVCVWCVCVCVCVVCVRVCVCVVCVVCVGVCVRVCEVPSANLTTTLLTMSLVILFFPSRSFKSSSLLFLSGEIKDH